MKLSLPGWTLVVVVTALTGLAAQQPRDSRTGQAAGSALIAGRVITGDLDGRPIRKTLVHLRTDDGRVQRAAITDDAGVFSFAGLPAGRYGLEAVRNGWARIAYGASRPHQRGTRIEIADGQQMRDVAIRLPRGAVLSGTIVDHLGHPLAHTPVAAFRFAYQNGERRFVRYRDVHTDERGAYRLFGLAAGVYTVATIDTPSAFDGVDVIHPSGDVDVRRALIPSAGYARLGSDGLPVVTTVGYAPVYYPGTPFRAQAMLVSVGAGDERSGLDFEVSPAQTLSIRGTVHTPRDVPRQSVAVTLRSIADETTGGNDGDERRTAATPEGWFAFPRVSPGKYAVTARVTQSGSTTLWGETAVTLSGDHSPNLLLTLRPALTISGHVRFDGDTPTPDASQIRVALQPVSGAGRATAAIGAAGDFTIAELVPGRYYVTATINGVLQNAWGLKSAIIDGGDALDAPLEVRSSSAGALVTFANRPAHLAGAVVDAGGRAAPEHLVIVFATNPRLWFPMSRRIRAVRPAYDGRYQIDNLPPGEYFITTARDVDEGEWYDSAWLQRAAGSAGRIAIAEGEKLRRDFRTE